MKTCTFCKRPQPTEADDLLVSGHFCNCEVVEATGEIKCVQINAAKENGLDMPDPSSAEAIIEKNIVSPEVKIEPEDSD